MLVATTGLQKTITKGALDPFITVTRILGLEAHQTASCTINATYSWLNLHHTIPNKKLLSHRHLLHLRQIYPGLFSELHSEYKLQTTQRIYSTNVQFLRDYTHICIIIPK